MGLIVMNLIFVTIAAMNLMLVGGGFTDGKYGHHFYTEAERAKYEREYADRDDRTEDDI